MASKAVYFFSVLRLAACLTAVNSFRESTIWPKKISSAGLFQEIRTQNMTTRKPLSSHVDEGVFTWNSSDFKDVIKLTVKGSPSSRKKPLNEKEGQTVHNMTDQTLTTRAIGLRLQVNYDSEAWIGTERDSTGPFIVTPLGPCSQESDGMLLQIMPTLTLTFIPETNFTCTGKADGYYADTAIMCKVFHYCQGTEPRLSFMCPPCTVFNQETLLCDFWNNVNCTEANESRDAEYIQPFT